MRTTGHICPASEVKIWYDRRNEKHTSREKRTMEPLVDSYGRRIKSMRISVTDKCNFRCTYCMPAEGLPWLKKAEILSYEEIERITRVAVSIGIEQIRLTGGEPLVRRDVPELVRQLRPI